MTRRGLISLCVTVGTLAAVPAGAQFTAADLVYLPVAAHTNGVGDSFWRSDLYITNVEEDVAIDVAMVYLPTGLISNASAFADRSTWLGGREDDGFGYVDPILADIPAGGTVVLRDPIGNYWDANDTVADSGAIVIFAYEADTLDDDGSRVYENVVVNSRVYTNMSFYQPDPDNEGEFVEVEGTFGQTLPAVPWYNLADPSAVSDNGNFSFMILSGAQQDEEFRYNVGILNASDPLTSITLWIQPIRGNGEPFFDVDGLPLVQQIIMPPLAHVQYNQILTSLFGLAVAPDDVVLEISFVRWNSGSADPIVGMTTYGNLIDNNTQDPTAILPFFGYPYNVECQWPPESKAGGRAGAPPVVGRRPVEIPAQ
jgi:hypothetical protein